VRGARGRAGARGQEGRRWTPEEAIARLQAEVQDVQNEIETAQRDLRTQFTRIAQIQAELDKLRAVTRS
jgi:hypothetical protein